MRKSDHNPGHRGARRPPRQDRNAGEGRKRQGRKESQGESRPQPKSGKAAAVARPPPSGRAVPPETVPPSAREPMRIAKAMARAGLCSRRDAERWIAEGRVRVNGRVLATPAVEVGPADTVLVDGKPLPAPEHARLWRYYKPKGVVTTNRDPEGRPTVFEKLPPELPRVVSVGRLDFNTEGLLLLTNDGALARHLELPSTGWLRRYRVRARGRVSEAALAGLAEGIEIEGVRYGPIEARIDTAQGANTWLTVGIREGKNREVRKIMEALGLEVSRLIRVSFGPFELGDMTPGAVEQVRRRHLAEVLGPRLAQDFGLSESPEARRERHARGKASRPSSRSEGEGGDEA